MVATVLIFALLSALFELVLLLKLVPQRYLIKRWVQRLIHIVVIAVNLAIHFGTIVGTMTAITSGLVSFATVPFTLWVLTVYTNYKSAGVLIPMTLRRK